MQFGHLALLRPLQDHVIQVLLLGPDTFLFKGFGKFHILLHALPVPRSIAEEGIKADLFLYDCLRQLQILFLPVPVQAEVVVGKRRIIGSQSLERHGYVLVY